MPIRASQHGYGFIFHCGADNGARWNVIQMHQSLPWSRKCNVNSNMDDDKFLYWFLFYIERSVAVYLAVWSNSALPQSQLWRNWQHRGDVTHTHSTSTAQHGCLTVPRIPGRERFVIVPRRTRLKWKYNWNRTWQFLELFGPIVEKRLKVLHGTMPD